MMIAPVMPALTSFESPLHMLMIATALLTSSTLVRGGATSLSVVVVVMAPFSVVVASALVLVIAITIATFSTHSIVIVVASVAVRVCRTSRSPIVIVTTLRSAITRVAVFASWATIPTL